MGFFDSLFGGKSKSPADAAAPYLQQIPGTITPYYQPYIQAGQQALPVLQQQYGGLVNDPTAIMSKIGAQYKASPGYQFNVNEATRAANQAAAAGGMLGSPAEQQSLADVVSGLSSRDYGDFMSRGLGLYGQGLGGMGGLFQTGYGASTGLAQDLASNLMSQANLAYSGQEAKNQQRGGMLGGMFGGLSDMFGGLMGGGGDLSSILGTLGKGALSIAPYLLM